MAFIVEDGSGVAGANAYATVQEVDEYLADRARSTENTWDQAADTAKQAAIVKATDHVEKRFGRRFRGHRLWLSIDTARTVLTFTQNPADGQTITLGSTVYTFRETPAADTDVEIGDSAAETLDNLSLVDDGRVTLYPFTMDRMIVFAREPGTRGNGIATVTDVDGASFSFPTTRGGSDTGEPQPLSFPRQLIYDASGRPVVGVPARLRQAIAEYAVRAHTTALVPDPDYDPSGRIVVAKSEKVGPVEESTTFEPGGALQPIVHPAADALLAEYLAPLGGVVR